MKPLSKQLVSIIIIIASTVTLAAVMIGVNLYNYECIYFMECK